MSWREKLLLTRSAVAEILSRSERSIDRLIRDGKLRARKEGRHVWIMTATLIEFVDGATAAAEAEVSEPLSPQGQEVADAIRRWRRGD